MDRGRKEPDKGPFLKVKKKKVNTTEVLVYKTKEKESERHFGARGSGAAAGFESWAPVTFRLSLRLCPFLTPRNATLSSVSVPWEENGWTTGPGPGPGPGRTRGEGGEGGEFQ